MMNDFSYDVMSEEEAQSERFSLLKDGEYQATVEKFEGRISKQGNRMVEFILAVYDSYGKSHEIRDFIAFTPKMTWKLRHHCESGGMKEEYENRTWRPQMSVGKNFRVLIKTDIGDEIPEDKLKGKPAGSKYPNKNIVDDYLINKSNENINQKNDIDHNSYFSDAIPF